jgi:SAM-dependent methyltransferase
MRPREAVARPYAGMPRDRVRRAFEEERLGAVMARLFELAGGPVELLDLGCGDGLAARLGRGRLARYLGVDLLPSEGAQPTLAHDLRDGLGPVGRRPFDVYLGYFGVASHMSQAELARLLREIARHGRRGSIVALEALGRWSLEWPGLWEQPPGPGRTVRYRLGTDVAVHPWSPMELMRLFSDAGIEPLVAADRTLQAGPKLGEGRYWPGLPPVRDALDALLAGEPAAPALSDPLPPLPAGPAALVHHELMHRRCALVSRSDLDGARLARAIWRLEPSTGGGFGHGLLVVGRVR